MHVWYTRYIIIVAVACGLSTISVHYRFTNHNPRSYAIILTHFHCKTNIENGYRKNSIENLDEILKYLENESSEDQLAKITKNKVKVKESDIRLQCLKTNPN